MIVFFIFGIAISSKVEQKIIKQKLILVAAGQFQTDGSMRKSAVEYDRTGKFKPGMFLIIYSRGFKKPCIRPFRI
jgi:hypothetical protein